MWICSALRLLPTQRWSWAMYRLGRAGTLVIGGGRGTAGLCRVLPGGANHQLARGAGEWAECADAVVLERRPERSRVRIAMS